MGEYQELIVSFGVQSTFQVILWPAKRFLTGSDELPLHPWCRKFSRISHYYWLGTTTECKRIWRHMLQVSPKHCSLKIIRRTFWPLNIFWFIIVGAHALSIIRACSVRRWNRLLERIISTLKHPWRIRPHLWHRINNIILLLEQLTQSVHVLVHEIALIAVWSHHQTFLADEISTLIRLLHLQHALSLKIIAIHATHCSGTYLHSVALRNLVNVLRLGHSSHTTAHSTI